MQTALLAAVRTMVSADSDPIRQALFANLRTTRVSVRAAWSLHQRLGHTTAAVLLVAAYGLKSLLTVTRARSQPPRVLAVAVHANAQRRVREIARTVGAEHVSYLQTGPWSLLHPSVVSRLFRLAFATRAVRKSFSLVRRINERHGFLVSCRIASLLGCYAVSKEAITAQRPLGVLVSSDSNPEELGLVAAARSLSIPTVFVSHAYTTSVSPPLDFSLSILEGAAAVRAYERKGPVKGAVFLAGVEGTSLPMDPMRLRRPRPAIGVFAPKAVGWRVLSVIIDDCRTRFAARQILIRWHPSMLERPDLSRWCDDLTVVVETSPSASLRDVAGMCDWAVTDANSNVLLPVLKLGVPTVTVSQIGVLDEASVDTYGFVANRVVFPPLAALRSLPVDEVSEFYGSQWVERFREYDASYLQPDQVVSTGLSRSLDDVLGAHRP